VSTCFPWDAVPSLQPGGARRCIRHRASRRVLSSPVREEAPTSSMHHGVLRVPLLFTAPRSLALPGLRRGLAFFLCPPGRLHAVDDFFTCECPSFRWDHFAFHGAPQLQTQTSMKPRLSIPIPKRTSQPPEPQGMFRPPRPPGGDSEPPLSSAVLRNHSNERISHGPPFRHNTNLPTTARFAVKHPS